MSGLEAVEIGVMWRSMGTDDRQVDRGGMAGMEMQVNRAGSRGMRESARTIRVLLTAVLLVLGMAAGATAADEGEADGIVDALIGGKPTLNVRGRIELGKANGLERSESYTIRTRLGYGTKPWYGVRIYTNFENIAAATEKTYWHQAKVPPPNKTPIGDPPGTEINVGFLEVKRPDWLGSQLIAGRQVIAYDDARFIGDVPWRQNQQTFDAVEARSSFGIDNLSMKYGWIGHVNRIFGGGGANPNAQDFESSSHLIHVSYDGIPHAKIAVFAYLLDLENDQATGDPEGNSTQTYGFRETGDFELTEKLTLDYTASYAFQADFGDKAIDYTAHYVNAETGLKWDGLGRLGVGFEMLGSDDGVQQFLTPIATSHKFNGWADVYLNNGGPTGLRDLYVKVAPQLPWKLKGVVAYHHFWDDDTGTTRGNEIDGLLKRPFGKHLLVLAKGAYFNSATDAFAEVDTWRFTFDVVVKF